MRIKLQELIDKEDKQRPLSDEDLVKEMSGPGVDGVDNEVEWDVRDVQSGVYFARIEAQSGGQNGSATVKIANVK